MRTGKDIPALTGVRGAAALWVALYHLLLPARFITGALAAMLARGYLAVDLFFVLSGFVMALTYGGSFRTLPRPVAVGRFLLRRIARLYPLYALILLSRFAYTALRYGSFALPRPWIAAPLAHPLIDIPANLFLVQAWGITGSSIGTAWSISTEWGAYFLFPGLCLILLWRSRALATAALCIAVALVLAAAASNASDGGFHAGLLDAWDGSTAGPMLRCAGGFMLGMAVWRISRVPRIARIAGAWPARAGVLVLFLGLLAAGAPDLAIYPLFPAIVLCLATGRAPTMFACRPLVRLGEISYALYLLHIFLLHPLDVARSGARSILPPGPADLLACTAILALLLVLSALCYRRIEMPGRALILRLGSRLVDGESGQAQAMAPRLTPNT
jgi:peptidoglycan/LPS O-acetylase OafA/YrhL